MLVAATTVAALLIASPSTTALDRIAADSGFLLGNAHRCGIASNRVVRAGEVVRRLIAAVAADDHERDQAELRFSKFFLVSSLPDTDKEKLVAACDKVASEFRAFERHQTRLSTEAAALGGAPAPLRFDLGAGE